MLLDQFTKYKTLHHWSPVPRTLRSEDKRNYDDCYSVRKVHQRLLQRPLKDAEVLG